MYYWPTTPTIIIIIIVGTQKLALVESFRNSHSNYSNNQQISKQQGKTLHNAKLKQLLSLNLNITIDNFHILAVLSLLFLSLIDFSYLCSFFPSFFKSFFFCLSFPIYSFNPYSYHYNYSVPR